MLCEMVVIASDKRVGIRRGREIGKGRGGIEGDDFHGKQYWEFSGGNEKRRK